MSSNVPPIQITSTGVVVPQAIDIRTGILADTNVAFGGDLDVSTPSTPQAYLADGLTQNITDSNAAIAKIVAMVDPATSEGRYQDGIARIYFLDRNGATASVVQAQCNGQPNVVMPAGQLAQDTSGNIWVSTDEVTFPLSGVIDVQFACQTLGPIELGIGELTKIAQLFSGWDAIVNLSPATVGSDVENRTDFERRRQESVSKNAHGSAQAIRSEVWTVPGVVDVFVYENFTGSPVNYGETNYTLLPHSVYVGVVGGTSEEIIQAIFRKKDAGCDMNGNTSLTFQVTDGYSYPYPEYTYKFNRPDSTAVKFKVQIVNSPSLPANITDLVKAAIIATFTGADGSQRARMGASIFSSNYYAGVAKISSSVSIIQIQVGFATADQNQITLGIDQSPTLALADIEVVLV